MPYTRLYPACLPPIPITACVAKVPGGANPCRRRARPTVGRGSQAAPAQEALRKWRFKPVMVDGVAPAVVTKATFNFVLDNNNPNPTDVMPVIAPATEFPKRVRVSTGVATGLLVNKVTPVYPDVAKAGHIQGAVILHALISKEGAVGNLQFVSGPPELAPSAIEAVKQWRYRPYLLNGRPVEVETQIQVNFTLVRR